MSHPGLSILIPAAGASKRLGQAKQLVTYRGTTLIQRVVDTAFSIKPREVIVVTGCHAAAVKRAVQAPDLHWLHHPRWSDGMGTTIAAGAARVSAQSAGLMVLLCDQWRIGKQDLSTLAETWRSCPENIVCAHSDGQNMPPAIFPRRYFRQLRELKGRRGAGGFLKEHPDLLTPVPLQNAAFDLDTKADLEQLKSQRL